MPPIQPPNPFSHREEYDKLKKDLHDALKELEQILARQKNSSLGDALAVFDAKVKGFLGRIEELARISGGLAEYGKQRDQQILALRKEFDFLARQVEALTSPPFEYAVVDSVHEDGTVTILMRGSYLRAATAFQNPKETASLLKRGDRVLVNGMTVIVFKADIRTHGETGKISDVLPDGRLVIETRLDEKCIFKRAGVLAEEKFKIGDSVLFDRAAEIVLEKISKAEDRNLWLTEVPNVTYEMIGGLKSQIHEIRKKIEVPIIHRDLVRKYKLDPSRGVFLFGPPGCGKTLIAKAMANQIAELISRETKKDTKGFFVLINGPEILNKYVGETERTMREIFRSAKERARENCPVIIFFDEADALFPTRGTGISMDVENTIVPQLLSLIDGVEPFGNVLVVLASNRQERIDPAVLRPGRIDRKIRVRRPDQEGVREIFRCYITEDLPFHTKYLDVKHPKFDHQGRYAGFSENRAALIEYMINETIRRMWVTDKEKYIYRNPRGEMIEVHNKLLELTIADATKRILYFKDLVSGALIKSIVDRAKENSVERVVNEGTKEEGLLVRDFCMAVEQEIYEMEDLPDEQNFKAWLKMHDLPYDDVVHAHSLLSQRRQELEESKKIETITTGHYF